MPQASVSKLAGVTALLFDVFGTVVDWRTSVIDELNLRAFRKLSSDLSPELKSNLTVLTEADWGRFAEQWRKSYGRFTGSFNASTDAWKTVDQHHRDSLEELLTAWGLDGLYTPSELDSLSLVWHRLAPWPDSPDGLAKLGEKYTTSTLSNGNLALLQDLNDFGSLGFHKLLSAETFKAYKPAPATYLGGVRELGREPSQVAMVAAHIGDLLAARECGLRTVYIDRPQEEASPQDEKDKLAAKDLIDVWVTVEEEGLLALANKIIAS
ncbi:unnamed protein product [Clonostachys solani]|uniref:Haloacid dehalogenase n=1 Tax=Clonostachys solani TaxID=160281 RepID=A0A9N9ZCM3_9HYPO|nr:unnamed protein product [Clonostachys solani]